ncbi:pollen-specific leucine-rich repeat extensin-like protein 2 [Drosophila innubila]|uniref:pollen-specific leucine-rich repeat extensin-like protein 2 n=1 Tax=Drosophila innubila TaxID=198719 RepID=UPI00148CF014|nr:pollen-specific leucine-rich repeat extensin-like protein 2 [Drosophila innubila]
MFGACGLLAALCVVLSSLDASEASGLRFPGPVLQRQEAAPYPPAGLTPDPPFELPTEQEANFPQPDLTYGPPEEQPELTYGPPEEEPELIYGPPDEVYGPPDDTYGPPAVEDLPDQTYGPPANDDANSSPQSAATISLASLRPQAQLVLPLIQRFTAFRQLLRPAQSQRRPAKLTARPQRRPAKVVTGNKAAFPATQLTLPFVERRIPFRAQRLILNAPLNRRPAKLTANSSGSTLAQLTPVIRRPIFSGGRIIAYSDKAQNW